MNKGGEGRGRPSLEFRGVGEMAKQQRRSKSFCNHIDPDKEEQLKRVKIAVRDQVDSVLKIMKDINRGNRERNLKKKSQAIELIQDFHKQYEKLYILYENLRERVKKSVEDSSPAPDSDAESNYWNSGNDEDFETSDVEDTLTCSSEVTKVMNSEPGSPFDYLRDLENQREMGGIRDLEAQLAVLRIEVSTLRAHRRRLEEQLECRSNEAVQAQDTNSALEAQIIEMEAQIIEMEAESREQEGLFGSFRKQFEDNKQLYKTRITELETQAEGMQLELSSLKNQKSELQEGLLDETKHWSSEVEGLMERVSSLQEQLETVNSHKEEMVLEIEKKSEEISHYLLQIEALRYELCFSEQRTAWEKESLGGKVHELESEIDSLSTTRSNLEEQINHEVSQSRLEREKLEERVSELQRSIATRENELSTGQKKLKYLEEGVESVTSKLETSESERIHLQVEFEALKNDKKLLQRELDKVKEQNKSKLEKMAKTNFNNVERKIEEMAVDFRKQFEDKYKILSRRIRVAEQLQSENKEWYRKTRDSYEQDNREMTARTSTELKNVKDLTVTANEFLTMIDSKTLKFKECTARLQNRMLKASRGIDSVKQWAATKNRSMSHLKDELDCLLAQLDDKETEILASREKVCKLEDTVTELEKIIKEKEDEVQILTKGKREAIRQLCIWVDYHKGRSDFYKDLLSAYRRHDNILAAL